MNTSKTPLNEKPVTKPARRQLLGFRATAEEIAEIERVCRSLGLSKSDYLRAVALSGFDKKHNPSTDQRLAKIEETLAKVGTTFDALLDKLTELVRIPTFREYRSRMLAEGDDKRPGEDEKTYLLRIATQYHAKYGVWPNPKNERTFGPGVPDDFPLAPPRG